MAVAEALLLHFSISNIFAILIRDVGPGDSPFQCFHNSEFCYFLIVNNNKYLSYDVDNIIFGISVPDYPSRTVESNSLR